MHWEYAVADRLHMTYRQLCRELGTGEMAYWRAYLELEHEAIEQAKERAKPRGPLDWRPPQTMGGGHGVEGTGGG